MPGRFVGARRALLGSFTTVAAESYEAESEAIFAAFTTPADATRKGHINDLVAALKTAGIWAELDVLYILAAAAADQALINWKNPGTFDLTAVNTPTFEADRGYTGNGSTSYLETGWNPTDDAVNYAQDDASAWVWSRTDGQVTVPEFGNATAPRTSIICRNASDQMSVRFNDNTAGAQASASGIGFFGASRTAAAEKRHWKDGSQVGTTQTTASTGIPNQTLWICAANSTLFSTRQCSVGAAGASLGGLESAFNTAVAAYMTAVGA